MKRCVGVTGFVNSTCDPTSESAWLEIYDLVASTTVPALTTCGLKKQVNFVSKSSEVRLEWHNRSRYPGVKYIGGVKATPCSA